MLPTEKKTYLNLLILAIVCDERLYAKPSVFDPSRVIAISNNSAWRCWYSF